MGAAVARREIGEPLDVEEPVDPEEGGAVVDGALAGQLVLLGEHAAAARSVDHPVGDAGDLPPLHQEAESVRAAVLEKLDVEAGGGGDELETRILAVAAQHFGLEAVAV